MFLRIKQYLCVAIFAAAGLAACGHPPDDEDDNHLAPIANRCQTDGLCVVAAHPRELSVGYRQGDREIALDLAARTPSAGDGAKGDTGSCRRVVWGGSHTAYLAVGQRCPAGWSKDEYDDGTTSGYGQLMPEMAASMADIRVDGVLAEPWQRMRATLAGWNDYHLASWETDDMANDPHFVPAAPSEVVDPAPRPHASQ